MAKSDVQEVLEVVNFIKDRMVTKGEFDEFRSETAENFRAVRSELRDINRRLDALEEQFGNLKGVTKEIDELRGRVKSIEEHLKIRGKTTA